MDLKDVLNRNQKKALTTLGKRLPLSIAEDERPYDLKAYLSIGTESDDSSISKSKIPDIKKEIYKNKESDLKWQQTDNKVVTNRQQTDNKVVTQPTTELLSSSSYKSTTTELPESWDFLDLDPLANIGFARTHLIQIFKTNIFSPELIQQSIYAFAFDLEVNKKGDEIKGNPLNYFIGILRKGLPYAPPLNYESPQDRALKRYIKNQQEIERKREECYKSAQDLAFKNWLEQINEKLLAEIIPELHYRTKDNPIGNSLLRKYFSDEIWPNEIKTLQNIDEPERDRL